VWNVSTYLEKKNHREEKQKEARSKETIKEETQKFK
jgi:hypothetical protein